MFEEWPDEVRKDFETLLERGATASEARAILREKNINIPRGTAQGWVTTWRNKKKNVGRLDYIRPSARLDPPSNTGRSVTMVIPDTHSPWEHPDSLPFLCAVRDEWRPKTFVHLGDEVDFYGMSRFVHDPDVINPGQELSEAVKHLIPFYREFPNVLVCTSNHTHRAHKKAADAGLAAGTIKSIEEILKTPEGWIYKQCHNVDGVDYKHGTGKSGPQAHINHAKATGRSTCIGHIHAYGAVNYLRPGMFAANFGCLIDKHAPCFRYAAEMDDNIVLGCGIVINGLVAYFIPMIVDENNRWIGEIL